MDFDVIQINNNQFEIYKIENGISQSTGHIINQNENLNDAVNRVAENILKDNPNQDPSINYKVTLLNGALLYPSRGVARFNPNHNIINPNALRPSTSQDPDI